MSDTAQKTILVVEDVDEISDNLNALLTRKGYRVVRAVDAEGALKIAEDSPPAVILTDFDLPSLKQMMDSLHAHETLKHLLVAVIDINHPPELRADLTVLNNFDDLDRLLASSPAK
jgi:CheY-like chemotaxis protein